MTSIKPKLTEEMIANFEDMFRKMYQCKDYITQEALEKAISLCHYARIGLKLESGSPYELRCGNCNELISTMVKP